MAGKLAALQKFLQSRSLVKDCTVLPPTFPREDVAAYCGFDPTAASLHLGHLVTLNALAAAAAHNIRPIALIGGGTALIGDPSGKSAARPKLEMDLVRANSVAIQQQIAAIFPRLLAKAAAQTSASLLFVNNFDIYKDLSLLDWLRNVGFLFPIRPLLAKDMVQARAEGLTYTEFSYQLLQAYDFAWLHRHHHCVLQIGGSDQWGNITTGTELIRKGSGATACGLTLPLITTETGEKFGKSEGNALFLDPSLTSPYHIFQYCYNLPDNSISTLLRRLTFTPEEEITALCQASPDLRKPQIALGSALLSVIHSQEMAQTAVRLSELLFSRCYSQLSHKEIALLKASITARYLKSADLNTDIVTILATLGTADSKSAVKKLISQKALRVNGELVGSGDFKLEGKAVAERFFVVQSGKKHMELLELRD